MALWPCLVRRVGLHPTDQAVAALVTGAPLAIVPCMRLPHMLTLPMGYAKHVPPLYPCEEFHTCHACPSPSE